ncbi:bifunctional DNA primase/polymerase [Georgenia sp. TF02-10]|uniref:bifunctional DNA primase/polymerase n=1 Tax=Georgenia sp. TF02-10 TaxID=2917725 RepID=UPI001FA76823|nr:bifunctional DNA primase/polymerase [Georgenia sp. TF02-10]UNX54105.1 bifunctional DNA primase/polymerase [Georgenia sp. TF02-10]
MTALTDTDRAYLAAATRGDQAEVARLSALVDAEQEAAEARLAAPGALLASATWYATALGLPVFPCAPGGKRPATPHGFKDATTDPGQIRAWWRVNPSYNVAAPTGVLFDAIDVDGPEGLVALGEYVDGGGVLPERIAYALTPRGRHLLVPPTAQGSTTNLLPSVDYRGRGGYVVLPPSRTPEGTYFWYEPLTTEVAA